jgi:hypothetical protein
MRERNRKPYIRFKYVGSIFERVILVVDYGQRVACAK